jgi:hypothetical protein
MAKRQKADPTYTAVQVEAALCVWEQLNEWTLGTEEECKNLEAAAKEDPNGHAAFRLAWIKMREDCGSAEMRSQSIVLGLWCLEMYDFLTKDDPDFFDWWSYDWEVIPEMLKHAVCKDGNVSMYRGDYIYSGGGLVDPISVAGLVAREFCWRKYEEDCVREAKEQWKFGDLVHENPEDFIRGFESGDDPKALVKQIGEDLDLIDFGPWK